MAYCDAASGDGGRGREADRDCNIRGPKERRRLRSVSESMVSGVVAAVGRVTAPTMSAADD